MNKQFIDTVIGLSNPVNIYYDREWEEYQVIPVIDGIPRTTATYYAADEEDAFNTAQYMSNKEEH